MGFDLASYACFRFAAIPIELAAVGHESPPKPLHVAVRAKPPRIDY
jgi:hypothetical protein